MQKNEFIMQHKIEQDGLLKMLNNNPLLFRRQYLLSPVDQELLNVWKKVKLISGHFLYTHPDLQVNIVRAGDAQIILLGLVLTFESTANITEFLIQKKINSFDELLAIENRFGGRYAIIYADNDSCKIFNDTTASRKVFYYEDQQLGIFCGSHPKLIADILHIPKTKDELLLAYYSFLETRNKGHYGIIDSTIYESIRQLTPNSYLDLNTGHKYRFWPNKKNVFNKNVDEILIICSQILQGFMRHASINHKLMLPLTSGYDSRTIMASSVEIKDKILYYTNHHGKLHDKHPDLNIPRKIAQNLHLNYKILTYENEEINKQYYEAYTNSNVFISEQRLTDIYHFYFLNYQDRLNIPGNFAEVAKLDFGLKKADVVKPEMLTGILGYEECKLAPIKYQKWIDEISLYCKENNINILDMFYWEERMGNWGTQFQMDKDIAQDEFFLLNSRYLVENLFSVPYKYRPKYLNDFYRLLIKSMWPELVNYPFNPNFEYRLKALVQRLKVIFGFYNVDIS